MAVAQPELSVTAVPNEPSASQLVMGSTGNTVLTLLVQNNTYEGLLLKGMNVFEKNQKPGQQVDVTNMQAFLESQLIGVAGEPIQSGGKKPGFLYRIDFPKPPVIPPYAFIPISICVDVLPYGQNMTDGEVDHFEVAVTGDPGNQKPDQAVTVTDVNGRPITRILLDARGAPQTILRSIMLVSAEGLGEKKNRMRLNFDPFSQVTLMANPAGAVSPTELKVTFGGNAPGPLFAARVEFVDPNGINITESLGATQKHGPVCNGDNTCWVKWTLPPDAFILSPGSSYVLTLVVDDFFIRVDPEDKVTLTAVIQKSGDVKYMDGVEGAIQVDLLQGDTPIVLNSVEFTP